MNIATLFPNKMFLIIAAMNVILYKYLYVNTFEKISICVYFLTTVLEKYNLFESVGGDGAWETATCRGILES